MIRTGEECESIGPAFLSISQPAQVASASISISKNSSSSFVKQNLFPLECAQDRDGSRGKGKEGTEDVKPSSIFSVTSDREIDMGRDRERDQEKNRQGSFYIPPMGGHTLHDNSMSHAQVVASRTGTCSQGGSNLHIMYSYILTFIFYFAYIISIIL